MKSGFGMNWIGEPYAGLSGNGELSIIVLEFKYDEVPVNTGLLQQWICQHIDDDMGYSIIPDRQYLYIVFEKKYHSVGAMLRILICD